MKAAQKSKIEVFEDLGVTEEEVASSAMAKELKATQGVGTFLEDIKWIVEKLKSIEKENYKGVDPADYMLWKRSLAQLEASCKTIEKIGMASCQDTWAGVQLFDEVCMQLKKAIQQEKRDGFYSEKGWERVKEASRSVIDTTMCLLQVESEAVKKPKS